jgi:hypothetical protein
VAPFGTFHPLVPAGMLPQNESAFASRVAHESVATTPSPAAILDRVIAGGLARLALGHRPRRHRATRVSRGAEVAG